MPPLDPTPVVVLVSSLDWNKILALLIPNITIIILGLLQLKKTDNLHTLFNSRLDEWKAMYLKAMRAEGVLAGRAEVEAERDAPKEPN